MNPRTLMLRSALLLSALPPLASAGTRAAQDAPPGAPWPMEISTRAFDSGKPQAWLEAVLGLLDREAEARSSAELTGLYLDVLGTDLAFVGEQARAVRAGDEAYGSVFERRAVAPPGLDPLAGLHPRDAVEAIVEGAKGRRIVMINEEHRSSVQRAFSNRLLEPLRAEGFSWLAVEALDEDAAVLAARGYPVLATGTYTRDPAFGDLLRRALALGYRVVPYEATPRQLQPDPADSGPLDATNRRERAQAGNLFARTFGQDPDARVLVIAGRDHIAEAAGGDWVPMGAVLKELSGQDPLTINQTVLVEHSEPRYEHWAYARADKAGWLQAGPVILADDAGEWWSTVPGVMDVSVLHPRTREESGRPDWMAMGGLRRAVAVEVPASEEPLLLQARVAGESPDAIPLDQVVLWPGQPSPALMLRSGHYTVVALDRTGREVSSRPLEVED